MKVIPVSIVVCARHFEGSTLELWMQTRQENGPMDGLLEFPGGKIEAGESPAQAGRRELKEEVGLEVAIEDLSLFKIYSHAYSDRSVSLFVHLCLKPQALNSSGWIKLRLGNPLEEIEKVIPEANKEIVLDICKYIEEIQNDKNLGVMWGI